VLLYVLLYYKKHNNIIIRDNDIHDIYIYIIGMYLYTFIKNQSKLSVLVPFEDPKTERKSNKN